MRVFYWWDSLIKRWRRRPLRYPEQRKYYIDDPQRVLEDVKKITGFPLKENK